MASQPEAVKFPLPPSPVPYDTAPEMRALAGKCPVARVELPDGSAAWLITGFSEVREVLIDQRYSRALAYAPGRPRLGFDYLLAESLMGMDPPEHSRLRKLVAAAFTEKRMQALRPEVASIVDDLLDDMIAGPRPADLVRSFSLPLPSRVICSLLGVPPEDLDKFHGWSNTLFGDWSRTIEEMTEAYLGINGYMAELIARKRKEPADDLITVLIDARDSGDRLSEDELVRFCFGLLMAGHETTANQINMSFAALCHHPAELARLRADPSLIPAAVEELLRFVQIAGRGTIPPARITREEVCLGGVTIPAGEAVLPMMNIADRDPAAFPDPDRLDVLRAPKTHVAFGAGAHHCLGAQLARMELQEAFRGLLARLPGLRMAVPLSEIEFREGHVIASMRALPVTWDDT
ncbi:MAG: cytochrome P450 [Streptosporangiaceae bacterium]|nr:cytochrome P450 [Streptosporangiaceae bacterium]MBV9855658.1 cytochrome P450 [Streptosporangiaceae bacterium]